MSKKSKSILTEKLLEIRKKKQGVKRYLIENFPTDWEQKLEEFNAQHGTPMVVKAAVIPPTKLTVTGKTATLEVVSSIRSVDQLLAEAKVDLTVWAVESHQITSWEQGRKDIQKDMTYTDGVSNGSVKDSGKVNVQSLFRVAIKLKKIAGAETTKGLVEFFKQEMAKAPEVKWSHVTEKLVDKNRYCLELAIPDVHLGKMSWAPETGGSSYDSSEAIRLFEIAVSDLVSKAPMHKVDTILFPVGSDFYNADNLRDETTSGTYVGSDTRWQKVFTRGCSLLTKVISSLAEDRKVIVPCINGNHDFERSFYLGEYLKAFFRNHPNVTIDNSPTTRKYFRYGTTLIGMTHGNEEKQSTLPLILATERPADWAATTHREWHLGHLHTESNKEYNGVKVRFLPAICPADSWHAKRGYVGTIRAALGFLYSFERGLEAQFYHNV
jgi:hypothetical protein